MKIQLRGYSITTEKIKNCDLIDIYVDGEQVTYCDKGKELRVIELADKLMIKIEKVLKNPEIRGVVISRIGSTDYVIYPTFKQVLKVVSDTKLSEDFYEIEPLYYGERYYIDINMGEGEDYGNYITIIPLSKLPLI